MVNIGGVDVAVNITIHVVSYIVLSFLWIIFGIRFWRLREINSIRPRRPLLVLASTGVYTGYALIRCIHSGFQVSFGSCAGYIVLLRLFETMALVLVFSRVLLNWIDFETARDAERYSTEMLEKINSSLTNVEDVRGSQKSVKTSAIPRAITVQRYLRKKRFMAAVIVGFSTFVVALWFVVAAAAGSKFAFHVDSFDPNCVALQNSIGFFVGAGAVVLLGLFAYSVVMLRKMRDNFGITKELIHICLIMIIEMLFLITNSFSKGMIEIALFQKVGIQLLPLLEVLYPCLALVLVSFVKQTKDAIEFKRRMEKLSPNFLLNPDFQELTSLLQTNAGFHAFYNYLRLDYGVERLLFWKDVENFRKERTSAKFIYVTYIHPHGPLHVHLPNNVFFKIRAQFAEIESQVILTKKQFRASISRSSLSKHESLIGNAEHNAVGSFNEVFDEAQLAVFSDLFHDAFSRYRVSKDYEKVKVEK